MARGSIRKHERASGKPYEVVVDLGQDPVTVKRRQRSKSFKTRREAQAALTAWLGEIDRGVAVDRSGQTVAEMMRYWLDTYARHNVRPVTLDRYETVIRVHIVPALGPIPVQKLTPAMLEKVYSDKLTAGCHPRTLRLCHLHLGQALRQAMSLGLVSRDVTAVVTPPRVLPSEMETWDGEQARRFLAVAHTSAYGPIWIAALATGMRRGELLGLRWRDVDFERGVLRVRQTIGVLHGAPDVKLPKTRSGLRDIPAQAEVLEMLRAHKCAQDEQRRIMGAAWQEHDLVFTAANGNPIHPDNLKRDYNRLVRAAGVPRIRIHDLRHSHVTLAIEAGANIKAVSQRVGHSSVSITLGAYAHVLPSQHAEVADKVGAILFPTREGASGTAGDRS